MLYYNTNRNNKKSFSDTHTQCYKQPFKLFMKKSDRVLIDVHITIDVELHPHGITPVF